MVEATRLTKEIEKHMNHAVAIANRYGYKIQDLEEERDKLKDRDERNKINDKIFTLQSECMKELDDLVKKHPDLDKFIMTDLHTGLRPYQIGKKLSKLISSGVVDKDDAEAQLMIDRGHIVKRASLSGK